MAGIDLGRKIEYKHASLRFFRPGEHHITRLCPDDVIVLVYDGILRFTEDGKRREVCPGEYYIQRKGLFQQGEEASDAPKYLYVHFDAEWSDSGAILPAFGFFDYPSLKTLMERLDISAHAGEPYVVQAGEFYSILSSLYGRRRGDGAAEKMAAFIEENLSGDVSLERLCSEFHFSKNHIINLFKKNFGRTPVGYINGMRLERAERLAEVTSDTFEKISLDCGFRNYSHFYRLFSRKHGKSPEEWRRERRFGVGPKRY